MDLTKTRICHNKSAADWRGRLDNSGLTPQIIVVCGFMDLRPSRVCIAIMALATDSDYENGQGEVACSDY